MSETIRVGIEDIEPNHWIAWVFNIPGCYASGRTREATIAGVQAAVDAEIGPPSHDQRVSVEEEWRAQPDKDDPEFLINACFKDDQRPLSSREIADGIQRLTTQRETFLDMIERTEALSIPGVGSIVRHMITAETWYLNATGIDFDDDALPDNLLPRMESVRRILTDTLPTLDEDDRVVTSSGEAWTVRKLLRRAIWHERDHTHQILNKVLPTEAR